MGDLKERIQAYLDKEGCKNTYFVSFYSMIWRYIILDAEDIKYYIELLKRQGLYKVESKVFNLDDIEDIPTFRTRIFISHIHHTEEDTRETLLDSLIGSCFRIHVNKIPARSKECHDLTYIHINLYPSLLSEWTSAEGRRRKEDISSDVNFYLEKIEEKKAPYDYIEVTYSLSNKSSTQIYENRDILRIDVRDLKETIVDLICSHETNLILKNEREFKNEISSRT